MSAELHSRVSLTCSFVKKVLRNVVSTHSPHTPKGLTVHCALAVFLQRQPSCSLGCVRFTLTLNRVHFLHGVSPPAPRLPCPSPA